MDRLTYTDIKRLIEISAEWCVSIYLPTHLFGREQQQDPIRLKNLLTEAHEKLMNSDLNRSAVDELLQPANELLSDAEFWQHQSDGLAIFLAPGVIYIYRLPRKFESLLVISRHFHITPLMPIINRNAQFYILALSLNEIRLLLANKYDHVVMELRNTPSSMQEALYMDDPEKHLNLHSASSPGRDGGGNVIFHGQGGIADSEKSNLTRYFQYIDKGIRKDLETRDIPMVLAGVDYLLPLFRNASSYPKIIEGAITGNPEGLNDGELHAKALELVKPIFVQNRQEALASYKQLVNRPGDMASNEIDEIVFASIEGRVDTLFTSLSEHKWGRINKTNRKLTFEDHPTLENEDLLDRAVVNTLLNNGSIFALKHEEMPDKSILAAIFRYAM